MRFIADENIPALLVLTLVAQKHNVTLVPKSKPDVFIAQLSKSQNRILLTLDKDFTNTLLFPPSKFNILHIAIHPPDKNIITTAILDLLSKLKSSNFKGLIILTKEDFIRYTK